MFGPHRNGRRAVATLAVVGATLCAPTAGASSLGSLLTTPAALSTTLSTVLSPGSFAKIMTVLFGSANGVLSSDRLSLGSFSPGSLLRGSLSGSWSPEGDACTTGEDPSADEMASVRKVLDAKTYDAVAWELAKCGTGSLGSSGNGSLGSTGSTGSTKTPEPEPGTGEPGTPSGPGTGIDPTALSIEAEPVGSSVPKSIERGDDWSGTFDVNITVGAQVSQWTVSATLDRFRTEDGTVLDSTPSYEMQGANCGPANSSGSITPTGASTLSAAKTAVATGAGACNGNWSAVVDVPVPTDAAPGTYTSVLVHSIA